MTNRRNFLKQTATLAALGSLSYPAQADERATKNTAANVAPPLPPTDIRSLTQHFNQPGG
ncbi:MAG: twin-arginine translocation signal domain-containing protein, partial [Planctomycetaceae bacterium]